MAAPSELSGSGRHTRVLWGGWAGATSACPGPRFADLVPPGLCDGAASPHHGLVRAFCLPWTQRVSCPAGPRCRALLGPLPLTQFLQNPKEQAESGPVPARLLRPPLRILPCWSLRLGPGHASCASFRGRGRGQGQRATLGSPRYAVHPWPASKAASTGDPGTRCRPGAGPTGTGGPALQGCAEADFCRFQVPLPWKPRGWRLRFPADILLFFGAGSDGPWP